MLFKLSFTIFISCILIISLSPTPTLSNPNLNDGFDWNPPPQTGDTSAVDPNNRLFYLQTDRYRSYAFPLLHNGPDTQIPYLDNSGISLTLKYTFSTMTKSEAAGIYICMTKNALISQSLWQMPGLYDQHCDISRFFVSDSDEQEQTHRFNHEFLPTGSAFGVMVVRFSNLTAFSYLSTNYPDVHNEVQDYNGHSHSDGLSGEDADRISELVRMLDLYQALISPYIDTPQSALNSILEELESAYFIAPQQFSDALGIYSRDPTPNAQHALLYPRPPRITQQKFHYNHIRSAYQNSLIPISIETHSKSLPNSPSKSPHASQTDLQFSLSLSGFRCRSTFGAYCDVIPIPLKTTPPPPPSTNHQSHPHQLSTTPTSTSTTQINLDNLDEDDEPISIEPGKSVLFYYNPTVPNIDIALTQIEVRFNSSEPLAAYSSHSFVPVFTNASSVSGFSAKNDSVSILLPDQLPGVIYNLVIGQPYPLVTIDANSSHSADPVFTERTWWLLVTNPSHRTSIIRNQTIALEICSTESTSEISYVVNRGSVNGERVTDPVPYCGFTPINHDFDGQLKRISSLSLSSSSLLSSSLSATRPRRQVELNLPSQYMPRIPTKPEPPPPSSTSGLSEQIARVRFQPYSHSSTLTSMWSLAFAIVTDTQDISTYASFTLYLRRNQYPIPPMMTSKGNYDVSVANNDQASRYTQYFSLPASTNDKPQQPKSTLQVHNFDDLLKDSPLNIDLNEDIWYGHVVMILPDGADVFMWYKDACPNQCGNSPSSVTQPNLSDIMYPYFTAQDEQSADIFESLGDDFHGQCVTKLTQVQPFVYYNSCECDSDWAGLDCTTPNSSPSPSSDFMIKWLGIIIVAALLSILLIILIVYKLRHCVCKCCTQGKNRPDDERTKLIKSGHYPSHSHLTAPHQLTDDINNLYAHGAFSTTTGGYYDHNGNFIVFQPTPTPLEGESQSHRSLSPYVMNNKVSTPNHPGIFQPVGRSGSFHITLNASQGTGTPNQQVSASPILTSANSHDVVTVDDSVSARGGPQPNRLPREQIPGPSLVITPRVTPGDGFFTPQSNPNNNMNNLSSQQYQQIIQLQQQQIQLLQQQRGQHGGMIGGIGYVLPNNQYQHQHQHQHQLRQHNHSPSYSPSVVSRSTQLTSATQNTQGPDIATTTRTGSGKIKTVVKQPQLGRLSNQNTPVLSATNNNLPLDPIPNNAISHFQTSTAQLARDSLNELNRQPVGNIGEYYNISFDLKQPPTNLIKQTVTEPQSQQDKSPREKAGEAQTTLFGLLSTTLSTPPKANQPQNECFELGDDSVFDLHPRLDSTSYNPNQPRDIM